MIVNLNKIKQILKPYHRKNNGVYLRSRLHDTIELAGEKEALDVIYKYLLNYFEKHSISNRLSYSNTIRIKAMKNNTTIIRKDDLDRFYTNEDEIHRLLSLPEVYNRLSSYDTYIEPSSGTGSIVKAIQSVYGGNIEMYDVVKHDEYENDNRFTHVDIADGGTLSVMFYHIDNGCVIMNPPFGKMCNTAIKFFNHLASFNGINAIAQIIPKTFRKSSIQNKLNKFFHLEFDIDYDSHFTHNGEEIVVPCCFQIWVRKDHERIIKRFESSKYIEFTTKDNADIAVRRAGGNAGKVLEGLNHTESSTYFIKLLTDDALEKLKNIDLTITNQTAGIKSISKEELIMLLGE